MSAVRLHRYDEQLAMGHSPRAVASAVAAQRLVRVRPGIYADGETWAAATPETRLVARARALALVSKVPPVFSHETAAAAHRLPLFHPRTDAVHVIVSAERPGAAAGAVRHRGELRNEDVVEIDGLRCTSLDRTVADMARTGTFEQAVAVTDAALRALCVPRPGEYLLDRANEFRKTARDIARRSAHGRTQAERVLAFADGRAQLPGESISRIRLHELGFRRVRLQVRVSGPGGTNYYADFGLDDVGALAEFDGALKYTDGQLRDGRTTAEVFDREKQREDWIRGKSQLRFVRWGWPHIRTAQTLADRLVAFGIRPPS
ncbi:hypothetical protein ACLQ2Q_01030 [Microbacterium sp. DT81.1]|uniref:hypothetical protein n=1 Tax=Microbacterium sp. DT81.1 TaxID=3393413 RepID=UPI003CF61370